MSDIFESKWGETKAALTEGLAGNKKKIDGPDFKKLQKMKKS